MEQEKQASGEILGLDKEAGSGVLVILTKGNKCHRTLLIALTILCLLSCLFFIVLLLILIPACN